MGNVGALAVEAFCFRAEPFLRGTTTVADGDVAFAYDTLLDNNHAREGGGSSSAPNGAMPGRDLPSVGLADPIESLLSSCSSILGGTNLDGASPYLFRKDGSENVVALRGNTCAVADGGSPGGMSADSPQALCRHGVVRVDSSDHVYGNLHCHGAFQVDKFDHVSGNLDCHSASQDVTNARVSDLHAIPKAALNDDWSVLGPANDPNFFCEFNSIPDFPFPPDDAAVVAPSPRRSIGVRRHDRVRLATDFSGLETPSMALRCLGYRVDLVAACDAKAELRRFISRNLWSCRC